MNPVITRLGNKSRKSLLFAFGAILGAVVFLVIFGASTLNVTYDSWIRVGYVEEDIIQHYATWQYYRNSPWGFPITEMSNVASPVGAAAAWGDPLPIAAVFFKFLSPVLPEVFQYFGIVTLLHFMLQGGFGCLLVDLFDKRWWTALLGALFFCLQPIFLERVFRHVALSAQWLVLVMLYLYFKGRSEKRAPLAAWCVVFGLIPFVHPYFLPMALGMLCATAVERFIDEKRFLKQAVSVAIPMAVAIASALLVGVIAPGVKTGTDGYGQYAMNLNALFNPRSADFFADDGTMHWSRLLPEWPQQYHHYDGFNYLGLGLLLLIVAMIVFAAVKLLRSPKDSARSAVSFLWSYIGLVVASLVFFVFSVSNNIWFGDVNLVNIPLPAPLMGLFSTFRASGRIFWPVGYLFTLCGLVFLMKRIKKQQVALLVMLMVLSVQIGDMSCVLLQKHQHFCSGPLVPNNDYESAETAALFEATDTLSCLGGPIMDYRFAECIIRYNPKVQSDIVFFGKGSFGETYAGYPKHLEKLMSGAPIDDGVLYVASEKSYCDMILAAAHEDVVAWKVDRFYLFGVATEERPAPDYE